jgi:nucleotide-binding universal stress UspA family protein
MILLCYDGSDDAQAALELTKTLFAGQPVTVLAVWEPYTEVMAAENWGLALGYSPPPEDIKRVDDSVREHATAAAQEAVRDLGEAGITAEARVEAMRSSVAASVLAVAADTDADAIVLGTRGRSGLKSLLLGSVSHAVLQHADRPVMVVPSEPVAAERRGGGRR